MIWKFLCIIWTNNWTQMTNISVWHYLLPCLGFFDNISICNKQKKWPTEGFALLTCSVFSSELLVHNLLDQLLCISTRFWVLRTAKCWSNYLKRYYYSPETLLEHQNLCSLNKPRMERILEKCEIKRLFQTKVNDIDTSTVRY